MRRGSWGGRLLALLAGTVLGCGGSDICLQCPTGTPTPGQSGVIVTGTIVSIIPNQTPSNVTVVICVDLPAGGTADNCTPSFFTSVSTQGTFSRNNVTSGSETIFFWVDSNDDGTIDPEDPLAQLIDSESRLADVQAGQTVTLANVSISFNNDTATADITVGLTPTPTPSAVQATPTPTPA